MSAFEDLNVFAKDGNFEEVLEGLQRQCRRRSFPNNNDVTQEWVKTLATGDSETYPGAAPECAGMSIIHWAAYHGNFEALKKLNEKYDCDIEHGKNKDGKTVVIILEERGKNSTEDGYGKALEYVRGLSAKRAEEAKEREEELLRQEEEAKRFMEEERAKEAEVEPGPETTEKLVALAKQGNFEEVLKILEQSMKTRAVRHDENGRVRVWEMVTLIPEGRSWNVLHQCVFWGDFAVLKKLCEEYHADIEILGRDGMSCLDIAKENYRDRKKYDRRCMEYLEEKFEKIELELRKHKEEWLKSYKESPPIPISEEEREKYLVSKSDPNIYEVPRHRDTSDGGESGGAGELYNAYVKLGAENRRDSGWYALSTAYYMKLSNDQVILPELWDGCKWCKAFSPGFCGRMGGVGKVKGQIGDDVLENVYLKKNRLRVEKG